MESQHGGEQKFDPIDSDLIACITRIEAVSEELIRLEIGDEAYDSFMEQYQLSLDVDDATHGVIDEFAESSPVRFDELMEAVAGSEFSKDDLKYYTAYGKAHEYIQEVFNGYFDDDRFKDLQLLTILDNGIGLRRYASEKAKRYTDFAINMSVEGDALQVDAWYDILGFEEREHVPIDLEDFDNIVEGIPIAELKKEVLRSLRLALHEMGEPL